MALIPCFECGKEISNKAVACAHCGAPAHTKIKTKTEDYLPEGFSTGSPLAPCRICRTEILRKAYVCLNCGIRNPEAHKNRVANIGLILFIFSYCLLINYDTWFRWGTFLPILRVLLMCLISIGWLWYAYQKVLE